MVQEDQSQKCCNSNSGGNGDTSRSSKKPKQKKLPQRGLGVAQLEKIRLEEQQKKDSPSVSVLSPQCSISLAKSSHMPLLIQNLLHSNSQSSSNSFPSPSPSDFSSPNSMIKGPLPVHNMDIKNASTVRLTSHVNNGVPEAASPSISVHDNLPNFWNPYEYDFEKDNYGVDPGLAFRCNISLPYESKSILPLPDFSPRTPYHQPPMVNVSSGIFSSSRSLYATEPPSNQRNNDNCNPTFSEEKVVSLKRPYPFSMDNTSGSYFSYKLPTFSASMRTDETTSHWNRSASNFDGGNSVVREGPSCSESMTESNAKSSNNETRICKGDFLTLAPPKTVTSFCLPSNFKQPSTFNNHEYPDFESLPYQGSVEDLSLQSAALGRRFSQERPFYSFLPLLTKPELGQTTINNMKNFNNEMGENVDLNLKL